MAASRRGGEVFYPPEEIGGEKNSPPLLPIARFEFTLRDFGAVAFCLLDSLPDLFSSKSLLVPINEEKAGNKAQWVNFLSAGPYEGNYKIHLRLYRLNADNDYVVTSRGSALNPDGERRKTMTPPISALLIVIRSLTQSSSSCVGDWKISTGMPPPSTTNRSTPSSSAPW